MNRPVTAIVIPARYGSTRLPGKPLTLIAGKPLIRRVWEIASAVSGVSAVVVATDDERIRSAVESFGGTAVMTAESCRNGTERVYEATGKITPRPDIVINLQGDAPLIPPWIIQALVDRISEDASIEFATPAVQLSWAHYDEAVEAKKRTPFSGCYVTVDRNGRALYFSKNIIPAIRARTGDLSPARQHIGIYAYRSSFLERYVALPPGELEETEGLEQLRALEHGAVAHVVPVDYRGRRNWAVDSPEDVKMVEKILAEDGELLPQ